MGLINSLQDNSTRARTFSFTAYGNPKFPTEEIDTKFFDNFKNCKFLCYGKEICPKTQRKHLQGIIHFKDAKSLKVAKSLLQPHHVECAYDPEALLKYCEKDGVVTAHGERPLFTHESRSKKANKANKDKFAVVASLACNGDLETVKQDYPQLFLSMYRTLKEIKKDHMTAPAEMPADSFIKPLWICGPTRTGKSWAARNTHYPEEKYYLKQCNKWWDGYQNEPKVILDDIGKEHHVLAHHIKIWADTYNFLGETKGGMLMIRPKHLIITSNYTIEEIFSENHASDVAPIKERFTVVHMDTRYNPTVQQEGTLIHPNVSNTCFTDYNIGYGPAKPDSMDKTFALDPEFFSSLAG